MKKVKNKILLDNSVHEIEINIDDISDINKTILQLINFTQNDIKEIKKVLNYLKKKIPNL